MESSDYGRMIAGMGGPGGDVFDFIAPTDVDYDDVYWRHYVRYQPGWDGGSPAKMSRTFSFGAANWAQAMINRCIVPLESCVFSEINPVSIQSRSLFSG